MFFNSAYSSKERVSISFPEQGMTKQSFKSECDINNIMSKYQRTGVIEFVSDNEPRYGDVSGFEFQAAMDVIAQGNSMFENLPSSMRKRFKNDAVEFLNFVDNPDNDLEAIRMGIKTAPVPSEGLAPSATVAGATGAVSDPVGGV